MQEDYKLVLGLEIHLHPKTQNKMFCYCDANIWQAEPNTHVCPTCLGLPGALPVPNFEAVKKTQFLGLALECNLNTTSKFDRKHYFYPDLPKGYQISQYKEPLCINGKLALTSGQVADIERIHLEEDVAKSVHEKTKTLIDFNKSGIPLVEIVTRPCFSEVEEAVDCCKKVQNIVRFLGIGDVDMEKGQMRLEANVSIRTLEMEKKNELGNYKVEIKNINSFRFLEKAVKAEYARQVEIVKSGGTVAQENRGYDEIRNRTVAQRSKEEARDYRYFPEPDIPPMLFETKYIEELRKAMPILPEQYKKKYVTEYGVSEQIASVLVDTLGLSYVAVLERAIKERYDLKKAANFLVNKLKRQTPKTEESSAKELSEDAKLFLELKNYFNTEQADTLDQTELQRVIKDMLVKNQKAVEDFKKGNQNSVQFLLGAVMKETKGRVDPVEARNLILKEIA